MAALRSGTGLLFNALSFGASLAGVLGARLLPAPILNALRGAPRLAPFNTSRDRIKLRRFQKLKE